MYRIFSNSSRSPIEACLLYKPGSLSSFRKYKPIVYYTEMYSGQPDKKVSYEIQAQASIGEYTVSNMVTERRALYIDLFTYRSGEKL